MPALSLPQAMARRALHSQRTQLIALSAQNIRALAGGTEADFETATAGYDERAGLVVEGVRVGVRAYGLGAPGVVVGQASGAVVVFAGAAVLRQVGLAAGAIAGVEGLALDRAVGVEVDCSFGEGGGVDDEVEGAPLSYRTETI